MSTLLQVFVMEKDIVEDLREHLIVCRPMDMSQSVFIPKHRFSTLDTQDSLPFVRIQFPLKLAYACTIHRAQGQTIGRIGIFLRNASVDRTARSLGRLS